MDLCSPVSILNIAVPVRNYGADLVIGKASLLYTGWPCPRGGARDRSFAGG
jgi:hypothetical protein